MLLRMACRRDLHPAEDGADLDGEGAGWDAGQERHQPEPARRHGQQRRRDTEEPSRDQRRQPQRPARAAARTQTGKMPMKHQAGNIDGQN
jgi:hypothetical protein